MRFYSFITIALIGIASCSQDSDIGASPGVIQVDPAFETYVQDFIAEGAARGQNINFDDTGLIVEFSEREEEGASGLCFVGQHHVIIDKSEWFALSENVRGFLLFHELGHCELDRGHRNEKFGNDVWRSIMRGSPLEPIEIWIPVPFFGFRKEYFIDELFNEQSAPPAWATATFDINEVPESSKELIIELDSINRLNQRFNDNLESYEIEVDFELIEGRANIARLQWGTTNNHYYIRFIPVADVFRVDGYFIGVHEEGLDNALFYSKNTVNVNGEEIRKITIRREGGFEKIFINDTFIFHIDPLTNPLQAVQFEATSLEDRIDTEFMIRNFTLKTF